MNRWFFLLIGLVLGLAIMAFAVYIWPTGIGPNPYRDLFEDGESALADLTRYAMWGPEMKPADRRDKREAAVGYWAAGLRDPDLRKDCIEEFFAMTRKTLCDDN